MALNIKNEHVHQLARQAAELTGKSQTAAIEEALERLLRDYGADPSTGRARRRLDVARRLAVEYRADPGVDARMVASIDDLYDDQGLPR